MPKLYITECIVQGLMPGIAEQSVEIDMVSTPSEPFNERTKFVFLYAEAGCSVAFGPDPKAKAEHHGFPAGGERWYTVQPGHRLAVVSND